MTRTETIAEGVTLYLGGGAIMHPDHYDLREAIRTAVLRAIDEACAEQLAYPMSDAELPALFRALDPIAERVFLKRAGL